MHRIYVSRLRPCLSPTSVSLHEMSAMICGGKRRVCLTDSSKHNGSIYQERPEMRSMTAGERRWKECEECDKETLGVS